MHEISSLISKIETDLSSISHLINIPDINKSIIEIDAQLNSPNIWSSNKAKSLLLQRSSLSNKINSFSSISSSLSSLKDLFSLASQENDPSLFPDILSDLNSIYSNLQDFITSLTLSNPEDKSNAILSIHPGAGGTESKDWAGILLRMYQRFADINNFSTELLHLQQSDEGTSQCIDSASIKISGTNAYGLLKNESGIHRLVRNSPFDSDFARHTSFAAVEVLPEVDDSINITINDNDVEIQQIRGSGSGGQLINKVSSCIRLKHIPTGIQIVSKSERDLTSNKRNAFDRLKAKLFKLELDKKNELLANINKNKLNINFGSQIRSYILSPYQLVNDHRSDFKSSNASSILDGNLNDIIRSVLNKNTQVL